MRKMSPIRLERKTNEFELGIKKVKEFSLKSRDKSLVPSSIDSIDLEGMK